ncbi:MAG TPA: insulinase family protein [Opitutales bacterium]|nr:insulinase family protein [Opitutales bacterium]
MKSPRAFLLLLAWLVIRPVQPAPASDLPPAAPTPAQPWPQANSDIAPDPAAVYGTLPNGLRYIIVPNKEPPGRLSLRLRVNAGSFMETDDQQGLAHFTEHMAFNGSKHFPPGEMVGVFQLLGMGFGADTNANTAFTRTLYMLELPDLNDKTVRESLQLFRDDADGLLLEPAEIDRERGVILSEKRDRDTVDYRQFVASWNFYFPNALLPKRFPIGQESVVRNAQRDRFDAFYAKWYTPARLTLIAVGDVKPEEFVKLIHEYFDDLAPRAESPDPALGQFGSPGFQALLNHETEAPAVSITLATIAPFDLGPDNAARRAKALQLDAANLILTRRFERIARQPNSPIIEGEADSDTSFDAYEMSAIAATCQPAQWRAALDTVEQELRRALTYGFTTAEVNEVRATIHNALERQAQEMPTLKSRQIAGEIAQSLDDNEVYTNHAQDLELAQPVLAALTPEQCLAALKEAWGRSGRRLFVSGNLDLPDAPATLTSAYNQSAAIAVAKPEDKVDTTFPYTSTGEPGTVVERHETADLGITQLRFANNVRVNLKRTDFEKDKIYLLVQFGGGLLDLPAGKPGLALVADHVFTEGGLGKLSAEELVRVLAGKNVGASLSTGEEFFELGGATTPRDFWLELELLKAYLTDPGYRPEALAMARRAVPALYNQLRQDVEAPLANEIPRFLAGGDFRFGYPSEAETMAVTLDDLRAWLAPALKDSYLEISIVGDFDPAAAESALAATFGALPARALKRPDYGDRLKVKFPAAAEGEVKDFTVSSAIPKAEALAYWPTEDESDIQHVRVLGVLTAIFSDRLRVEVRQKLGQAYSPEVSNFSSEIYPGYGYATALITADPKLAPSLADQARAIGDDLAKNGVTQEEFDRAVAPLRTQLVEYRRRNAYWLQRVLAGSQIHPQQFDWARTLPTAYDEITPAQVSAAAKEYFSADHAVRVLVRPVAPPAAAPSTSTAPPPAAP